MMIFYITSSGGTAPVEILTTCAVPSLYSPACMEIITLFRSLSVSNSDCPIMPVCPKSWLHAPINTLTANSAGNVILYWLSFEYEEIVLNSVLPRSCPLSIHRISLFH